MASVGAIEGSARRNTDRHAENPVNGGIGASNCAPLVRAGADFLAVVGAVWNHPEGPAAGVRAMNTAIKASETAPHPRE